MKAITLFLSASLVVCACSSEPNVVHVKTVKGSVDKKNPVTANQILTMEVEGMTCEMGCGGSIRKELKATGGVARVEFVNFDEEKTIQTAKISFDSEKVTKNEILKIVTTMNEKQFKVAKSSLEKIETESATATESADDSAEEKVEISESNISFPNLLNILSDLIQ